MKNFIHLPPENPNKKNNQMKVKSLIAIIALVVAIASCGTKKDNISEKLKGAWSGSNTIEITMTDSTGNTIIQQLVAPMEIEYAADSTFTAVITINDTTHIKLGGVVGYTDTLISMTGTMATHTNMDITGVVILNDDATISLTYTGTAPDVNVSHKGIVTAVRKVK
jgi:outer membrane lipoprotein-sorting protein